MLSGIGVPCREWSEEGFANTAAIVPRMTLTRHLNMEGTSRGLVNTSGPSTRHFLLLGRVPG